MFWMIFFSLLFGAVALFFLYGWKKHQYWKEKGVKGPPCTPIFGHFLQLFDSKQKLWLSLDKDYKQYKDCDYYGTFEFFKPRLTVTKPELVKLITVKDFDHFVDRRTMQTEGSRDEILKYTVLNASKDKWKSLRGLITPAFTSGKLKSMFPLIDKETNSLVEFFSEKCQQSSEVDMVPGFERLAINIIASCAFGVDGKCFEEDNPPFLSLLQGALKFQFSLSVLIKMVIINVSPRLFNLLDLTFMAKEFSTLQDIAKETIAKRRESGIRRGDFLDMLLDAQNEAKTLGSGEEFSENFVVAQTFLFIIAGFDTTKSNLSFAAYNLAKNPEVQDRLREKLKSTFETEGWNYQSVMDCKYLDAFLSESLRVFPAAFMLERECTKAYRIPDTDLTVTEGMLVGIPTYSLHYDSEYWEQPEKFDLERFLPENKEKIKPYTYLPFGSGPRNCLGMRFAHLEMKMAIAKVVLNFRLTVKDDYEIDFGPLNSAMKPTQLLVNLEKLDSTI